MAINLSKNNVPHYVPSENEIREAKVVVLDSLVDTMFTKSVVVDGKIVKESSNNFPWIKSHIMSKALYELALHFENSKP